MQIINSTPNDITAIFELYDEAIAYQKKVFDKHWQGFDQRLSCHRNSRKQTVENYRQRTK
jgi:L-amino acid N-acyltransferase YncA